MDPGFVAGIVIGLAGLWAALLVLLWLLRPRGLSARDLLALVPQLVRLLRRLATDASTPLDVRVVVFGLALWIVSPIDLIPEFIPVIGPLDDVVVAVVALRYIRRRMGIEAIRRSWTGTPAGFELLVRVLGNG